MGTVPVPYSPVAGDDATQARVLTWADTCAYLLGSATSGGSKRAIASPRQTVAQTVANITITPITFDAEELDYDNGHSLVTNTSRYTAQTAGWYFVQGVVCFAANATGFRMACILKNGTEIVSSRGTIQNTGGADTASAVTPTRLVFLNVGDYVEIGGYQNSGAGLATSTAGAPGSGMTVEWRSN